MSNLNYNAKEILKLTQTLSRLKTEKEQFMLKLEQLEKARLNKELSQQEYEIQLKALTQKKSLAHYNQEIRDCLEQIQHYKESASENLEKPINAVLSAPNLPKLDLSASTPLPTHSFTQIPEKMSLPMVDKPGVKRFSKSLTKEKKEKPKEYYVYKTHSYAKVAYFFMGELTFNLINKYKDWYEPYNEKVHLANLNLMTKTYVAMLLFTTLISFPLFTLLTFLYFLNFSYALLGGIVGMILTFLIFYFYPHSTIKTRQNKIRIELVFATVHMAAVSGSGANPEKIFKLLVDSGEYPELEPDLKRILNNLNLFGYNLTTSLKSVASSTASPSFKDLLNGMVSTIETGGDLTQYLQEKAKDALETFRLDQKRYLSALSSFADVYTGVLITAPLLFIITLAILEKISPTLAGMPISSIAFAGTYIGLPVLNALFIAALTIFQPEI